MWRPVAAHERIAVAGVIVAGTLIRLPFAVQDQHVIADPELLLGWARHLTEGGLPRVLSETSEQLYPPLGMLGVWFSGLLTTWIGGPAALAAPTAVAAIKAWPILADAALALLMARLLRAAGPWASLGGAAAIAFNPAFWYLATLWGQIDSVAILLLVAALAAMSGGHVATAWAGWAGSILWKLQGFPLAPLIAAYTLRTSGLRRAAGGAILAMVVLALAGTALLRSGGDLAAYFARLPSPIATLEYTAFNTWYLVTRSVVGTGAVGDALQGTVGNAIGYGLAGVTILVIVAALWRRPKSVSIALCAAMTSLAVFAFLPGMHERYLLPVIPMLALVAGGWPAGRPDHGAATAFLVITATQTLNLVAVGSPVPNLWQNVFAPGSTGPLIPVVAALGAVAVVANLVVLGWGLRRLIRQGRAGFAAAGPAD